MSTDCLVALTYMLKTASCSLVHYFLRICHFVALMKFNTIQQEALSKQCTLAVTVRSVMVAIKP